MGRGKIEGAPAGVKKSQRGRSFQARAAAFFELACDDKGEEIRRELALEPRLARAQLANDETALMWAARRGSMSALGELIEASDLSARTSIGETALMWAATGGSAQALKALLPGSDPLALNAYGNTALARAVIWDRLDCVGVLLPVSEPRALVFWSGKSGDAEAMARDLGREEIAELIAQRKRLLDERDAINEAAGAGRRAPGAPRV